MLFKTETILAVLLLPCSTFIASASAASSAKPAAPGLSYGTRLRNKREDIFNRFRYRSRRQLRPRASAVPCDTVVDDNGECCVFDVLTAEGACCPTEQVILPECGGVGCCDDGAVYQNTSCCRSPGILFTPDGGQETCCDTGLVDSTNTCCTSNQVITEGVCTNRPPPRNKRNHVSNPDSFMVKRSLHAPRTLLSADLMADLLVNNGAFTYNGFDHIDNNFRGYNAGSLRRLAGKGIAAAVNLAFREGAEYDADMWNSMDHMAISESYEFAVKDVPEIYARIIARPDFETFLWRGASFDRDIVSGHP